MCIHYLVRKKESKKILEENMGVLKKFSFGGEDF